MAANVGFTTAYKGNVANGVSKRGITTSSIATTDGLPDLLLLFGAAVAFDVDDKVTTLDVVARLFDTLLVDVNGWP